LGADRRCLDPAGGRLQPSPIVSLNGAVAVAMVEGLPAALGLIDELAAASDLHASSCCIPLVRIGCAASDLSRRQRKPMIGRSRW
jgi:predicted RNA polymerase sigma factor